MPGVNKQIIIGLIAVFGGLYIGPLYSSTCDARHFEKQAECCGGAVSDVSCCVTANRSTCDCNITESSSVSLFPLVFWHKTKNRDVYKNIGNSAGLLSNINHPNSGNGVNELNYSFCLSAKHDIHKFISTYLN